MSLNHSKRPTIYAKMKRPKMDTEWYRTNWTNQQTVHFGMQTAGQGQVTTANTTEWHPQVNYETSGNSTASTWEPPRWSHQSISLSVAPGLSPKIVGAKRSVTETMLQGHMTHNWHFLQWRSSTSWLSWRSKVCSASFWLTKVITGYSDQPFQIQKRVKYLVLMQTWCEVDTSIAEAVNKHQISSDQNPDDRHASTKICLTPSWKPRSVGAAWIQHLQTSRKFVDSPGTGDGSTCNASKSLGEARHSHRWRVCV